MRKFLLMVIAALVGVSTLAACGTNVSAFKLNDSLTGVNCENVVNVSNQLDELAHAEPSSDRDDALKAWGFDSSSDKRIEKVGNSLLAKNKECKDGSSSKAGDNGTAVVTDNGKKETVPLVDQAPKKPSTDTTADPMTPASLPAGLCPTLEDWSTLVDCVDEHDLSWYIDGVNQRAKKTGFDWSDIKRWANAKNADTAEVRAIEVFGKGITDKEARSRAAELVGDDTAKQLVIVRQPACFNNTRGLENNQMQDFVYCPPGSRQVRVSLLPAVLKDGKIVAIMDTDSGVFVDCDNLWWIPEVIKTPGNPPQCQNECTPPPKCKKDCTPPPKCPPGQHGKPPICKDDPSKDPAQNGNAPVGGGHNDTNGPGSPNPQPTFQSKPRTNPPPPSSGGGSTGGTPSGSTPTTQPSQPPATGANDPDSGSGSGTGNENPF